MNLNKVLSQEMIHEKQTLGGVACFGGEAAPCA